MIQGLIMSGIGEVKRGEVNEALLVEASEVEEGVLLVCCRSKGVEGRFRLATRDLDQSIRLALEEMGAEEGVGMDDEREEPDKGGRPLAKTEFYCSSESGEDNIIVFEERVLTEKVVGRTTALKLEVWREKKPIIDRVEKKAQEVIGVAKEKASGWGRESG